MSDQDNKKSWASMDYWQERFTLGDTPWELNSPSTVLVEACSELMRSGFDFRSKVVLSAGCGRGADALCLARRGARVVCVDWSEVAIAEIRRHRANDPSIYPGALSVQCGDFFAIDPEEVDVDCEHTFFCALDPDKRKTYVETILKWLKPGGFLVGNFFIISGEEASTLPGLSLSRDGRGPPFATTEQEMEVLFNPFFEKIVFRRAGNPEPTRRPGMEFVGIFRLKANTGT